MITPLKCLTTRALVLMSIGLSITLVSVVGATLAHLSNQPSLFARSVDGEYEMQQFRGSDRIVSPTFPEWQLTVEQIFNPR